MADFALATISMLDRVCMRPLREWQMTEDEKAHELASLQEERMKLVFHYLEALCRAVPE